METKPPNPGRWPDAALIILFGILLLLPSVAGILQVDSTASRSENRRLAAFPKPPRGPGGLADYFSGCQAYFNDHFGGRRALIAWGNQLALAAFGGYASPVLIGRDGWLYYTQEHMVENFRGDARFSPAALLGWQKLLEARRDWLARRGIAYVFVIAPNKESIYPEHLPAWLVNPGRPTKTDQFVAFMQAHSSVRVVDLRPALLAAKKSGVVYLQTDTHWNQLGAFIACNQMVRSLADLPLPGLQPLSLADFDCGDAPARDGDLATMLGVGLTEDNAVVLTPKPGLPPLTLVAPASESERLPAYSKQPGGRGLAIVYHDSFGRYWRPLLGYQFHQVDYFWQTFLDGKVIAREQPVVVVNEMVERFLDTDQPAALAAQDTLP